MPDEILSKLGGIEAKLENLTSSVNKLSEFKDDVLQTVQEFDDYKEGRKTLPDDIRALKEKTATCQINCQHHTQKTEEYFKKTDYLIMWSYKISGAQMLISILAAAIVILVQLKIL